LLKSIELPQCCGDDKSKVGGKGSTGVVVVRARHPEHTLRMRGRKHSGDGWLKVQEAGADGTGALTALPFSSGRSFPSDCAKPTNRFSFLFSRPLTVAAERICFSLPRKASSGPRSHSPSLSNFLGLSEPPRRAV
jgi:hypothetical protein